MMGGGYCTGEEREKDKGGGEGRMGGKDEERRGEEEKERTVERRCDEETRDELEPT